MYLWTTTVNLSFGKVLYKAREIMSQIIALSRWRDAETVSGVNICLIIRAL